MTIDEIYNRERTSNYIHTVTFWWGSATIDYYTTYVDNLKKVTRADIQDYVRKYIKDKPKVAGILMSSEMKKTLGVESYDQLFQ